MTRQPHSARFLVVAVGLLAAIPGCPRGGEGHTWACECTFLTDTDDTSVQKVEVCEATKERAEAAAVGCAQSGAPARVERCSCPTPAEPKPCRAGACTVHDQR